MNDTKKNNMKNFYFYIVIFIFLVYIMQKGVKEMKKMLKKAELNTKKKTKAQVAFLNNHIFIYKY